MTNEAAGTAAPSRGVSSQDLKLLVEQAQQGNRDALEELYLLHFDRVYSYLHMSVGNRHDAEDLTTQVFVKMLESIGKFRWRSAPFSAWLFRIAHNLAMDHFRANKRWQPEEEVPQPDPDERLEPVAAVEHAKKVTPASLRVIDVPGTGAQLLGNLRQVDALLVVLDAWSGMRNPDDDLATLRLELLIADRDHVEKRLERVAKQAKSGDPQLRAEVASLEAVLGHLEAERPLSEWPRELPAELEPL